MTHVFAAMAPLLDHHLLVLIRFPWRMGLFSPGPLVPVHVSVYVRVRRTWFCPVFHGARHVPSTTGVGRFFSRIHVQPVHGSVYVCVPRTWFCPVFHVARPVPSTTGVGRFFPCPRTARSRVRVRACASYVVLPSFPWRASRSVHDGRRPFFSVSTYSPFTGPCTCVCVVHGFAQFSMGRVTFRPRRASAVFFTCPRTARSRVRVRACASYVVLPSFPWRASRSVHDGRRPFFSTCPRTARSRVRVSDRVSLSASYVVLPCFPWRVSRSVHDGRRPFFPVSTYSPFHGSVYVVLPSFPWCASSSVHDSCPCLR